MLEYEWCKHGVSSYEAQKKKKQDKCPAVTKTSPASNRRDFVRESASLYEVSAGDGEAEIRTPRLRRRVRFLVREFAPPCKASDTEAAEQCFEPMARNTRCVFVLCSMTDGAQKKKKQDDCPAFLFLVTRTGIEPMFSA